MDWSGPQGDFLFGVIFAVPFLWVKRYAVRTALSTMAPLIGYWFTLKLLSDPEHFRINAHALLAVLGGFCGAHIRFIWVFIRRLIVRKGE